MERTASLAVVLPLLHVARLLTDGTAAATDAARMTRERKSLENMAMLFEGESAVDAGVSVNRGGTRCGFPTSPHHFIPSNAVSG